MEYSDQVMKLANKLFELLSEVLGLELGYLKKIGCADGLAILGHYYPTCPQPETSKTNMSTTTSSVMRAMQAAELNKAIEEVNGVKRTILEELHNIQDLKRQYEEELAQLRSQSQCNNAFQPIPRDPRDPFDGGSGAPSSFPIS